MMKTALSVFTAVLGVATLHCLSTGSGQGSSRSSAGSSTLTTAADFCHQSCARVGTCDTTKDVDTCSSECSNNLASVFPKLRGDFVDNVEQCWQQEDCRTVLESSSAFSSCVDEAEASLAPSTSGTSFCDGLDASWKKCGTALDRAKCLGLVKQYDDDALGEAAGCLDKGCVDIDACINAALDLGSIGASAPSGPSTPQPSDGGTSGSGGTSGGGPVGPPSP
jgi:hypothetical protein